MNNLLIIIALSLITIQLSAQRKFTIGFEYAFGVSEVTDPGFSINRSGGLQLGRNAFLMEDIN